MWHADSTGEVQLTLCKSFGVVLIHIHHFYHFGSYRPHHFTDWVIAHSSKQRLRTCHFCSNCSVVRFPWRAWAICLMAPSIQLGLWTKWYFRRLFLEVWLKKLTWRSLPSVRENKRDTRESFDLFAVTSLRVCWGDREGEKIERKILVSQYLSNCLHLLGDKNWHHFLSVRTHFRVCTQCVCACDCEDLNVCVHVCWRVSMFVCRCGPAVRALMQRGYAPVFQSRWAQECGSACSQQEDRNKSSTYLFVLDLLFCEFAVKMTKWSSNVRPSAERTVC